MDVVPLPQRPLFAFDDQQRLAREDEKALLVGLPVVHRHRLAGTEHEEIDADLRIVVGNELRNEATPRALPPLQLAEVADEPLIGPTL